ncbi:MAG: DNA translocase FtsK [Chloroflexi bacterium]|nr:DNA translocase FtsK [Chloroflexota bacterium]
MVKGKEEITGKRGARPRGRSWWLRLFRLLTLWPVWIFLLLVVAAAVVWWRWPALTSWAAGVRDATFNLFGWGLILLAIAVAIALGMIWRRRLLDFVYRWRLHQLNRLLGAIAFILSVWGVLALLQKGGAIGQRIIGQPDAFGALRVVGLLMAGVVLVAPRGCFRLLKKLLSRLVRLVIGRPARRPPRPAPSRKEAMPAAVVEAPPPGAPETKPAVPASAPAQTQQELRQVAQEVWRKYGESSAVVIVDGWRLPPIDILDKSIDTEFGQADNMQRAKLIEEAMASYGVEAKVVQVNAGPTVTQFGVEPGWERKTREIKEKDKDGNVRVRVEEVSKTRVKVDKITGLANDLALALAASSIRIEAPVPGKSVVGIEVPNTVSSVVSLRGVIETSVFQKLEARSKMALALGKGAGGEAVAADLAKMPHLLIAGATGSGKTVCLNTIICCLLLHNTPNDARFFMVDPKRVELTPYNGIAHLAAPVIVDTSKALSTLRWLNQEMDKRYQELSKTGARNIESYNKTRQGAERMPYLVLVIDELADLMMAGFDEVEHILCRLAQLARATGIHLVVATQRPSVDVITGLIKANFPTRISFAVTSQVDSRTILDMAGAEKLLGRGDMLYMPTEAAKPKRLQGCLVSDAEIERLVYFWGNQRREETAELKIDGLVTSPTDTRREDLPQDPLLDAARQLAQQHKHISTSFLQRRLRIGYPRAARLMEQLEDEGVKEEEQSG